MDHIISLEPLIRQHVALSSSPSVKGWWTCKCAVCNDRKKRGGFRFEGNTTTYHCFNCGTAAVHDPIAYNGFSKKMIEVLDSFFIPEDSYKAITLSLLQTKNQRKDNKQQDVVEDPDVEIVPVDFPTYFKPIEVCDDAWGEVAKEYLQHHRGIEPLSHPFHLLEPAVQSLEVEQKWRGRLIIPFYRNNQIIYYQGRDLRLSSKLRYLNAETTSECILSDYDVPFKDVDKPLYVCEGIFDALSIGGVAVFGNRLKRGQIKILNKSRREKVYIPDKAQDALPAVIQALDSGWAISLPDIGHCKDMNDAVCKYGKLYVLTSLKANTIHDKQQALIRAKLWCIR